MIDECRRNRLVVLWLFGFLVLLYVSTAKGFLEYGDDISMFQVTQSIAKNHVATVPANTPGSAIGLGGRLYSKYGIGQSVLAVPLYIVGEEVQKIRPGGRVVDSTGFVRADDEVYAVSLLGIFATAATGAILYLTCRELGISETGAIGASLGFGLGTFAWHYSRTFMTEPTSTLCLFAACYATLCYSRRRTIGWVWLSGVCAGVGVLIRTADLVILAPLAVWLIWCEIHQPHQKLSKVASIITALMIPVVVSLTIVAVYNFDRFGSATETGYGTEAYKFTTPLYVGLYGLLLSPGKSVFAYAPIAMAGMLGWFHFEPRHRDASIVFAAVVGTRVLMYSAWYEWYGGGAWGPRFLVIILPFIMVGFGVLVDRSRTLGGIIALAGVSVLSVLIQVVAVLVPYVPYEGKMEASADLFNDLLWNPAYSPIISETQSLLRRQYPPDLAPTYYASSFLASVQLISLVAAVAVTLAGLWLFWKHRVTSEGNKPDPSKGYLPG